MSWRRAMVILGAAAVSGAPLYAQRVPVAPAVAVVPSDDGVDSKHGRDPFRPPKLGASGATAEARTPLERYELGQLRLVAVVYGGTQSRAVVEDDQGLGYIVKIGTRIGPNGGEVAMIDRGKVVVREDAVDFYGDKRSLDTVLEMKTEERPSPAQGRKKP